VIETALRLMDDEGLEAVTMRRLGRELGVEAMSLYNHVEDKEDLLDALATRIMSEFRFPPEDASWREAAWAGAHEWRRILRAHPHAIELFAHRSKPVTSVEGLAPMEFALDLLRRAGLTDEQAVWAFHAIGGFIMGFVMLELGVLFGGTDAAEAPSPEALARTMPVDQLPAIRACLAYLCNAGDVDEQFDFGLEIMLAGLGARFGVPASS
jgi:AcrR family transcriptional regulator